MVWKIYLRKLNPIEVVVSKLINLRIWESWYFFYWFKQISHINNYLHFTKLTRDFKWEFFQPTWTTVRMKTFRDPVTAPSNICRSFRTQDFFSCRNFLGGCQIEFNWDFRMSYRPWVSDNLKSTVKVGREGSMSISDRKSKEGVTFFLRIWIILNFARCLVLIWVTNWNGDPQKMLVLPHRVIACGLLLV